MEKETENIQQIINEQEWLSAKVCYPYFIENEIYKSNFEPGCDNYQLGEIHWNEWCELITNTRQLVLLAPRDHLKSFTAVEAYACWKIKYNPGIRITIISKTDKQAKVRIANIKKIIEAAESLQWLKPKDPDSWSKQSIITSNKAEVVGAGYFSGLRGGHQHLIILDDPIEEDVIYSPELNQKYTERFFMTILPMAEADTQILVIGTRQCEGDLYDSLKPPEWVTKEYRAVIDDAKKICLFPEKWPWDKLMARKDSIVNSPKGGLRIWKKEYMNDVTSIKGNIVKYSDMQFWLKPGETRPIEGEGPWKRWASNKWQLKPDDDKLAIYQGWDLNISKKITANFTACITIGVDRRQGDIYILDAYKDHLTFPERLAAIGTRGDLFPGGLAVGIEDIAFQDDTVQAAIRESNLPIKGIHSATNKLLRLESCCTLFVNHKVYCRPEHADFIEEVVSFPMGINDDQLDAFDMAVLLSRKKKGIGIINMAKAATDPAIIKQLEDAAREKVVSTVNELNKKIDQKAPLYTKTGPDTYDANGTQFKVDKDGIVCMGPSWLLGRTFNNAIQHLIERTEGVKESNKDYDKITGIVR